MERKILNQVQDDRKQTKAKNMKEILEKIKRKYEITDVLQKRDDLLFFSIGKKLLVDILNYLKELEGFTHLVMLSSVDWLEENKFQLSYIINHPVNKYDITIRVFIDRDKPVMDSIHQIWLQSATDQREIKELFGIDFPGSPGVDDDFVLEDWDDIPPMRRDFDTLKYATENFFPREGRQTHDTKEYMKSKLYPDKD
ncbi:MAG: NADH-quinone oxidoreductase subunit C [Candidatus Delongbacteria bacterium]|nr:NADH-quinone oxidoreductase subunit C [Candidatus Delongbacteria bacterium]